MNVCAMKKKNLTSNPMLHLLSALTQYPRTRSPIPFSSPCRSSNDVVHGHFATKLQTIRSGEFLVPLRDVQGNLIKREKSCPALAVRLNIQPINAEIFPGMDDD